MPLSSLHKGPAGRVGLILVPETDETTSTSTCVFFDIDLRDRRISSSHFSVPYNLVLNIQLCYDQVQEVWVMGLDAGGVESPLEVYEIACQDGMPWQRLFAGSSLAGEYVTEKKLYAFWRHGKEAPLLFHEPDPALISAGDVRWTHWRARPGFRPSNTYLSSSYSLVSSVREEGCLLFSCQCVGERRHVSQTLDMKPEWHFHIAAYQHDGTLIHQQFVPEVLFESRATPYPGDDLDRWLVLTMEVCAGPPAGAEQQATCVAALIMYDHPAYLDRLFHQMRQQPYTEGLTQGGLYWVDLSGRILRHDPIRPGKPISLCLCGEQVIGCSLKDGQWSLWNWFPASTEHHNKLVLLSPQLRRATVIAPDLPSPPWFWRVEEYAQDIRVIQRACDSFEELDACWYRGIRLPELVPGRALFEVRPQGILPYEETLLIIGLDDQACLHLLQFQ